VEQEGAADGVDVDHPRVGEELREVTADRRRAGIIRGAEVQEQEASGHVRHTWSDGAWKVKVTAAGTRDIS
jgi:hypothetical protein